MKATKISEGLRFMVEGLWLRPVGKKVVGCWFFLCVVSACPMYGIRVSHTWDAAVPRVGHGDWLFFNR